MRAPTTLGTFRRALKFGRVRQLDAVAARFLTGLTVHGGLIDTATLNYVDMDDAMQLGGLAAARRRPGCRSMGGWPCGSGTA